MVEERVILEMALSGATSDAGTAMDHGRAHPPTRAAMSARVSAD